MYDYFRGLVIRDGTDGPDGATLRALYEAAGWCSPAMPRWQDEKFEIAMRNSAWAFTVWDGKKLVEKCLAKLPCGNRSARTTPENYAFYEKCGFSMPKSDNATMEYDG